MGSLKAKLTGRFENNMFLDVDLEGTVIVGKHEGIELYENITQSIHAKYYFLEPIISGLLDL